MCIEIWTDICADIYTDICTDMCIGMCIKTCADMCMEMCIDLYTDVCTGLRIDMCYRHVYRHVYRTFEGAATVRASSDRRLAPRKSPPPSAAPSRLIVTKYTIITNMPITTNIARRTLGWVWRRPKLFCVGLNCFVSA